jgi:penicillin-binding protein 1C
MQIEKTLDHFKQRLLIADLDAAAIVAIENSTGDIVGLTGSFDYNRTPFNAAKAKHQAGSILKPFLYAMLLERGFNEETPMPDFPRAFRNNDDLFQPHNYDLSFHGYVPLKVALGSSLNVPAVSALETVGVAAYAAQLRNLEIPIPNDTTQLGLGLPLGDVDVSLIHITKAFGHLSSTRAGSFSIETRKRIVQILSDEKNRELGFHEYAHLYLPFELALKTGTSTFARDFWAVGSTTDFTIGIWVGSLDGRGHDGQSVENALPLLVETAKTIQNH